MASICETHERPVLKAHDTQKNEILIYQPRCKMWACLPCANIQKLLWQAKVGHGVEWYKDNGIDGWSMLTVTAHERCKNFAQCLKPWTHQWSLLSARMRRKYKGFRYVMLPELHIDKRIHWHIIASHNIAERWLKDNARNCGLGYMAEAKPIVDNMQAVYYVSKYISKSLYGETWLDNLRRIRTSQKWPLLPPGDDFVKLELDWTYISKYPSDGLEYLREGIEANTGIKTRIVGSAV